MLARLKPMFLVLCVSRFPSQWSAEWLGIKGQPQRRWVLALSGSGREQRVQWGQSCKEEVRLRVCVHERKREVTNPVCFKELRLLHRCRFVGLAVYVRSCQRRLLLLLLMMMIVGVWMHQFVSVMRNFTHLLEFASAALVVMSLSRSLG